MLAENPPCYPFRDHRLVGFARTSCWLHRMAVVVEHTFVVLVEEVHRIEVAVEEAHSSEEVVEEVHRIEEVVVVEDNPDFVVVHIAHTPAVQDIAK